MAKNKKEFDIERSEYDDKVEEIRKEKRKLRDIQEPGLVKKIKKDLPENNHGSTLCHKASLSFPSFLKWSTRTARPYRRKLKAVGIGSKESDARSRE